MYPKKSRELIPDYAKEQGIPEQDLEDMVNGYYKAIRTKLSALEYWNFRVRGLGDFRASRKKVVKAFYKLLRQKMDYRDDTSSMGYIDAVTRLEPVKHVLRVFREEYTKQAITRNRKIIFRNRKKDDK